MKNNNEVTPVESVEVKPTFTEFVSENSGNSGKVALLTAAVYWVAGAGTRRSSIILEEKDEELEEARGLLKEAGIEMSKKEEKKEA